MGQEWEKRHYEGMGEDGERVLEWEMGLPSAEDLTPLSQALIPPELASAFSIAPEPARTMLDVHRACQNTVSSLRLHAGSSSSSNSPSFPPFPASGSADDPMVLEADDSPTKDSAAAESSRKARNSDAPIEETDPDALRPDNSNDDQSARTLKRPRLVWTPQLHKRFVDVVAHLGIKQAVPKTIMQLMNVEGLTRENVASHLQKYRLYLKRMRGASNEGPSSSDQLFASTPVPQSLHEQPKAVPVPMPYAVPTMFPMPVFGMAPPHGQRPIGMVPVNSHQGSGGGSYPRFDSHQPYGAFGERPKDWSGGNNFGSIVSYPRVTPNDN